jgi:hypothetical protein
MSFYQFFPVNGLRFDSLQTEQQAGEEKDIL